ncbi:hypothetical protein [Mucilaginibacter ginsenosidivorax]|nr:hypothetical protein [Mucilaginibacter ginsenosidivorax]
MKKVTTFADPNGGLLYEAKEVKKAGAILVIEMTNHTRQLVKII